ncbi:hypothetical protein K7711_38370 [Nocardia sp. CA2R105]|nr:hypothetical protein [Nocardia coffeae]MBY8862390.1 hypothetical protein [Nocardia coffeae]
MIAALLFRGPIQKLPDYVGEFATRAFGLRTVKESDETGELPFAPA